MVDVTDATFEAEVLARSTEVPVVVDLWAEWCGPCRTLTPILEKVVAAADGRVALAKIDIDANPGAAQSFQVQSIPAVYAVKDRKVVDGFIGAQPEWQVQQFVDRLAPAETEVDRLLAAGDEASLRAALELEPADERVVTSLAEWLVGHDGAEEALQLLERIPETPDTRRIAALARTGDVDDAEVEGQLAELLDRAKDDEEARREFVDLLEVLGPDHPRTAEWRKRLTTALY